MAISPVAWILLFGGLLTSTALTGTIHKKDPPEDPKKSDHRPNIVVFLVDDVRNYIAAPASSSMLGTLGVHGSTVISTSACGHASVD